MRFDEQSAEIEYVNDLTSSYPKLAEKYGVNYSTVARAAKRNNWQQKRKEVQQERNRNAIESTLSNDRDKLKKLRETTDKIIESAYKKATEIEGEQSINTNELKQLASALKDLIYAQRDLNGILSEKDKLTLSIEKADENESGIVIIPAPVPDAETVVSEGDDE